MCWHKNEHDCFSLVLWNLSTFFCLHRLNEGLEYACQTNLGCDDGKESIDDCILNQWPKNDGNVCDKQIMHWRFYYHEMERGKVCRFNTGNTNWFSGQDQRDW